jgi:hypothetical protein
MRVLFFVLTILFLFTSCAAYEYDKTLTNLHGSNIDQAVALLGAPTRKEANFFVWSKARMEEGGGYYNTTYRTVHRQGPQGQRITEQIPEQKWVAPYTTRLWCETTIRFSDAGIIAEHTADGNDCP